MVRIHADDGLFETLARIAAVRICGCDLLLSAPPDLDNAVTEFLLSRDGARCSGHARLHRHSEAEVMAAMADVDRIRYAAAHRVPTELLTVAAGTGFYIARSPVLMEGRIELLHYFVNQSICDSYHRYGNLGERSTI
jgi:RHH-type proline utilization regulon transcriptional repressor/proline dehydrogenase/delta 1-pyrroline-5-carboxylate dehydrogenase